MASTSDSTHGERHVDDQEDARCCRTTCRTAGVDEHRGVVRRARRRDVATVTPGAVKKYSWKRDPHGEPERVGEDHGDEDGVRRAKSDARAAGAPADSRRRSDAACVVGVAGRWPARCVFGGHRTDPRQASMADEAVDLVGGLGERVGRRRVSPKITDLESRRRGRSARSRPQFGTLGTSTVAGGLLGEQLCTPGSPRSSRGTPLRGPSRIGIWPVTSSSLPSCSALVENFGEIPGRALRFLQAV